MREQAFLQPGDEHRVEFQPLGGVHCHQLQRVVAGAGLMLAGFERGVSEEGIQRVLFGLFRKQRGGVDQFVEVLQAVGAFLVGAVIVGEARCFDDMVDGLGQRQIGGGLLDLLDQPGETGDLAAARTGGLPQAGARTRGCFGQLLQRARADAAGGEVDHAQERAVVFRMGQQAQIGDRVLDFLAFEKAQSAVHAIRHARRKQRMFQHPRLRVGAVQERHVGERHALAVERLCLVDHEARLVLVGIGVEDADRLAFAFRRPQVLAEAVRVLRDQRVGGGEDVAVAAVVLLQLDHVAVRELALELGHVGGVGAAEGVDRLVVVADREQRRVRAGEQLQPAVLQRVGVLEFVDQDVLEAVLIVLAQRLVAVQQFVGAQQQFGKIRHPLALALRVVGLVQLGHVHRVFVERLGVARAPPGFLVAVDEPLHLLRFVLLGVDVQRLHQPLDRGELVGRIEDLERLRQPRLAPVRAQQPVGQTMEGADPHAARVDRQHRRDAGEHLLRRLVGEGHREDAVRRHLPGLDQPHDARGQHPRLARAGARQNQRRFMRQRHGGALFGVEVFQQGLVPLRVGRHTGVKSGGQSQIIKAYRW